MLQRSMTAILAAVLVSALSMVAAEGPASAPAGVDLAARARSLRSTADAWWAQRRKLGVVCFQCRGTGQVLYKRAVHTCPKCDGRKRVVPADVYRTIWYEMRSPAFRAQEGVRQRMEQEYKQALSDGVPEVFQSKVERHELVDATHGLVHVTENKDTTARPQRWIWAEEPGKKPGWWLWDAGADGEWPEPEQVAPASDVQPGEPLLPQEAASFAEVLRGVSNLGHKVQGHAKRGTVLLLTLDSGPQPPGTLLEGVAVEDWRLLGRALWAGPSVWTAIEFTMRARHRDRFGAVEHRPYLRGRIGVEDFRRIRWENLAIPERLALFSPERLAPPEGWTLWKQE